MSQFFLSYNNGIIALVREDHAKLYGQIRKAGGNPVEGGLVKIFTFCHKDRYNDPGSTSKLFITGTYEDAERLISLGKHEVANASGSDWDGYVPFSNRYESGAHGEEIMERERLYVTTLGDIFEIFGESVFKK